MQTIVHFSLAALTGAMYDSEFPRCHLYDPPSLANLFLHMSNLLVVRTIPTFIVIIYQITSLTKEYACKL